MRLDGRRLVRALVLGVLVLLLVGGGTGFAMASAEAEQPAAMAFPKPGDSATYTGKEFIVGDSDVEPSGLDVESMTVTWLPEVWVADRDFNLRLAHPLYVEATFENNPVQKREAYYDAATGEPILNSGWGAYTHESAGVGCDDEAVCQFRYDEYDGRGGPCGMRNDLQIGQALDKPLRMTGYCDYADGEETMTYRYTGRDHVGRHDAYRFSDPHRPEFRSWFVPDVPFPVRFTSTMADHVYGPWLANVRMYDLRMTDFTPGTGQYTHPVAPLVEAGPGPIQPVARTDTLFDFAGFPAPLSFPDAYAAAAADTTDAGLAGFLRDHPDAYVGEAYSQEKVDEYGSTHYYWFFAATDGDAWKPVFVSYGPAGASPSTGLGGSVPVWAPAATGNVVTVGAWQLEAESVARRDAGHYYVTADLLPAELPRPADVLVRQAFVENHDLPGSRYFGWNFLCETAACLTVDPWIAAGYQSASYTMPLLPGLQEPGANGDLALLSVAPDGVPSSRNAFTYDRPSYSNPLLGDGDGSSPDYELAPTVVTREAGSGAWRLPTGAAAASLSFLALVASALYYFWPALKGAAGVGLFSRIDDGKVLDHPTRRRIHDAIASEPGIHFQALARKSDVGRGALEHHLRKLVAADVVTIRRAPGFTCYFLKGTVDRHMLDAAPALRSDGSRAVLQAVVAHPGASSRDLAAVLGIAPSTMSYHLKRLETAGLVAPGEKSGVRVTPLGSQAAA